MESSLCATNEDITVCLAVRLLILLRGRMWRGVDIEFLSRICVDEIDQGVEFSSLHRPMANLESIVVFEEKTSVRVKEVLGC
jgi:hypothetical protein